MNYRLKPYKGAGKIRLGMTKQEIRNITGEVPKEFHRAFQKKYKDEMYDDFFIYYTDDGKCDAIEFFNNGNVIFKGKYIFNMRYVELKLFFKSIDSDVTFHNTGITSIKHGIGVYAPFADEEPTKRPEGVIVFTKGYYYKGVTVFSESIYNK